MLDLIILIMLLIFVIATILIVLVDQFGLEFKSIETVGKKRLYWIFICGVVVTAIGTALIYSGVLPDGVQGTLCGWLTSTTQNMMGNACN